VEVWWDDVTLRAALARSTERTGGLRDRLWTATAVR
jgi:hypothetical protein